LDVVLGLDLIDIAMVLICRIYLKLGRLVLWERKVGMSQHPKGPVTKHHLLCQLLRYN